MQKRSAVAAAGDNNDDRERERRPASSIRFRSHLHNTVYDVCKSRGWRETDSDLDWDLHWADVQWVRDVFDHVRLEDGQRVNHFRNHYELTRKDLTIKNLKRMKKTLEKEDRMQEASRFDFFPPTYVLPAEYGLFEVDYKRNPQQAWIMKPIGRASGKGIFLFTKISQISEWKKDHKWRQDGQHAETYVVQRYIETPHLVAGKKYDLRLYALVTSYSPLTVWLYRSGFCRFSHHRFSMNMKEIDNNFVHLTNTAIQKTSNKYTNSGCKWGLRRLRQFLISTYGEGPTNSLFGEIQALMLRTLQSVQKIMINDKHCFELYGFDVLVDDRLKPWLIEVNASPSMSAETPADYQMKFNLLDDLLGILDIEKKNTGNEERVGGYDLIWKNGPVGVAKGEKYVQSYLGCANEKAIPMSKIKLPPRLQAANSGEKSLI